MLIATTVESTEAISRLYSMRTVAILAVFLLFVFLSIRACVRGLEPANEHPSVFSDTVSNYPHIIFAHSGRENATKCAQVAQVIQSPSAAILLRVLSAWHKFKVRAYRLSKNNPLDFTDKENCSVKKQVKLFRIFRSFN